MKNSNYTSDFAKKFKRSYACKMGGTQTIVFPNGQRFAFDDREYYSGRGVKYNSSIRHDNIGEVVISRLQLKERLNHEKYMIKAMKEREKIAIAKAKRVTAAAKNGIYSIAKLEWGEFVELSEKEATGCYFDASRLANTLKISVKDAELLNSEGKTYVFAKSEDGNTYELYHSSLSCNDLSISINIATPERIAEFSPGEWQSAPYASMLGQTINNNHFVC
jgi:hypothetical protein